MRIYEPITIFDSNNSITMNFDRASYFKDQVRNKSVLHVGCSDYPLTEERLKTNNLLHQILENSASKILGIDCSIKGINILEKHGLKTVKLMDAENMSLESEFDIILTGDVLEHMNNPGKFLEKVPDLLTTDGELIIGAPNAFTLNAIKVWFLGREYTHKDHTFYFSPKTLTELCSRYNLLPVRLVYTVQPKSGAESDLFIMARKLILKRFKTMSPSFIMHFKKEDSVNSSQYFLHY